MVDATQRAIAALVLATTLVGGTPVPAARAAQSVDEERTQIADMIQKAGRNPDPAHLARMCSRLAELEDRLAREAKEGGGGFTPSHVPACRQSGSAGAAAPSR